MIITIYRETINKDKKLFKYTDKDGKIVRDKKILDYIEKLRIPPAYRDCEIFYDTAGKVLKMVFWGFDDAGRKQQIYSKEWRAKADKNKFKGLIEFGHALPKIQLDALENIENPNLTKNKIISIIIRIINFCGFRIGSQKYQKLYGSFGISTVQKKHFKVSNGKINIEFVGKKGMKNDCEITDPILVRELNAILKTKSKSSDSIFTYEENGENKLITGNDINKWLESYNSDFLVKYFRTFSVNDKLIDLLKHTEPTKLKITQRKKIIKDVLEQVSCSINNTAAICKKSYVNPELIALYIEHPKKYESDLIKNEHSARLNFIKFLEREHIKKTKKK